MRSEKAKGRKSKYSTDEKRGESFRDSIRDGRKYGCVCCHRLCFKNGVKIFNEASIYPTMKDKAIGEIDTKPVDGVYHICTT